jgi:hypothetical protein
MHEVPIVVHVEVLSTTTVRDMHTIPDEAKFELHSTFGTRQQRTIPKSFQVHCRQWRDQFQSKASPNLEQVKERVKRLSAR